MSDTISKRATFQIGGSSSQAEVSREAKEFASPSVFKNRSAYFPNPDTHKVKLEVVSSVPKAWQKPPSPVNTHFVEVTVKVSGDKKNVDTWIDRVMQNTKNMSPAAYASTTDRAKHVVAMGAVQANQAAVSPAKTGMTDHEKHVQEMGLPPQKKEGAAPVKAPEIAAAGAAKYNQAPGKRTARIEQ